MPNRDWRAVLLRRGTESSTSPTIPPAKTKAAHGKKTKLLSPPTGRKYASIGSGSARERDVAHEWRRERHGERRGREHRDSGPAVDANSAQSAAAAMIDGPMMLRMSTFRSQRGDDQPRIHAWKRKRNASPKISSPRRTTARDAAATSPVRRNFDPADSDTDNAGEEQKERRAEAAEDHRPGVLARLAIGKTGPAVEDVRLDHDEHGETAQQSR